MCSETYVSEKLSRASAIQRTIAATNVVANEAMSAFCAESASRRRRFHAANKWPKESDLPGFRQNMLAYMDTLEALCRKLVRLYALALDLPETFFDDCFRKPHIIQRMSRYPLIDGADENLASLVPHTDSGFMTLLPPNCGMKSSFPRKVAKCGPLIAGDVIGGLKTGTPCALEMREMEP